MSLLTSAAARVRPGVALRVERDSSRLSGVGIVGRPVERNEFRSTSGAFASVPKWASFLVAVVFVSVFLSGHASAAVPALNNLFPAGGQVGSSLEVAAGYKCDSWPPKVWTAHEGLKFSPDAKAKGKFKVEIGAGVPPGPHLIRIHDKSGASVPRAFVVSPHPNLAEKESNNGFETAQAIDSTPVVINGRWSAREDVDSFAVALKRGQWLTVSVEAYSLHSPTDPVLHLLDPDGVRVGFNHDRFENLDPRLEFRASRDGRHVVQIAAFEHPPKADVRYYGSSSAIYRLTLVVADKPASRDLNDMAREKTPNATSETEPNDGGSDANAITFPAVIDGAIASDGDVDRYAFTAKKGEKLQFEVFSRRLGFGMDSHLAILDKSGRQLAENDDRSRDKPDSNLVWTSRADGDYAVAIRDIRGRGSSQFQYRLVAGAPTVGFEATVDKHSVVVAAGKSSELKVKVTRVGGHKADLKIEAQGLPEGVEAVIDKIPAKTADVKVTLKSKPDAGAVNQPIRFRVIETDANGAELRSASATNDLNGDPKGDRLVNRTDSIWLTVTPAPEKKAAAK